MKVQKLQVLECPVPGCGDEILWPEDWLMLSWVNPEQFGLS